MRTAQCLASVALLLALASAALGDPTYSLTDCGPAPAGSGFGTIGGGTYLNDSGEIVTGFNAAGLVRPLYWSSSTGQVQFGVFGEEHVQPYGITNGGTVYGNFNLLPGFQAFSWTIGGGIANFNPIVGAVTILDSRVDTSDTFYFRVGTSKYLWQAGSYHAVTPEPAAGNTTNASGDLASAGSHLGHTEALRWVEGTGTSWLGVPAGYTDSFSIDINDSGVVAGFGRNESYYDEAAIFAPDGTITKLGTLGGSQPFSDAFGINNSQWVVGRTTSSADDYFHGFVWSSEFGMLDLQTHLDSSGAGWTIYDAEKINENGQIVGFGTLDGTTYNLVLLTPVIVPEPATLSLLSLAALALLRRRSA